MAIPKKGLRKITVNNIVYLWSVNSTRENLSITICSETEQDKILKYYEAYAYQVKHPAQFFDNTKQTYSAQMNVVSNRLITEIITTAIANNWKNSESKVFWVKQDQLNHVTNSLFQSSAEAFKDQEMSVEEDSLFQLDLIQKQLHHWAQFNYLDLNMWTFSPKAATEEFHCLFLEQLPDQRSKYLEQNFYPVEDFIIKMLTRYARFINIPYKEQKEFIARRKFCNKPLSTTALERHLLPFLHSENAPQIFSDIHIKSATLFFTESLFCGTIAKTNKGTLGLIWESAG